MSGLKSSSYIGKVAIVPWLKTSQAGKPWTQFTLETKLGVAHTCVAFDQLATDINFKASAGCPVVVQGYKKDGKLFLTGCSFPAASTPQAPPKKLVRDVPRTFIDDLMDALGPVYVTKRMRELFKDHPGTGLLRNFPQKQYKALIAELTTEAGL